MDNFRKVAVLMGGTSNEREVSLQSGKNVAEALSSLGKYEVVPVVLDANDLAALPPAERPALFQYCGVDDFLWSDNLRFRDHLRALGLDPHWEEGPGGHSWGNWDERIRHVLAWLPLSENTTKTGSIGV